MSHSIILLRRAGQDFRSIANWLKMRSPRGAENWRFEVYDCLSEVAQDPYRYEKVAEASVLPHGVRQALFHTPRGKVYRLIFLIEAMEVRVLRIRAPGQRRLRRPDLH